MGVFINLLDEALDNEAFFPENNVSDGTMDTKEAFWVSKLFDGLQELVVDIESLLKNHLLTNQFDRSSREGMESLRMHLKYVRNACTDCMLKYIFDLCHVYQYVSTS